MRTLRYSLLLLMLLMPAARLEAAPIVYDFTVTFNSGSLALQSFQGTFSVDGDDCPGGICDGAFLPNVTARTLLSVDMTIDGMALDITDDVAYPSAPLVVFSGGNVTTLRYLSNPALNRFLFIALAGSVDLVLFNDDGGISLGTITNIEQQAVPEPATLLMLGCGLAGVGTRWWRQRRA